MLRDVTKRRETEEEKRLLQHQLQQAQKMESIGTLAGGIAHDFNNILGAILGYSELAKMYSADNPKALQHMDQLCIASERARGLVEQILAFSRQSKTEMQPVDIGIIIKEALKLLRATIPTTIQIRQNVKSNLGSVKADQTQIHAEVNEPRELAVRMLRAQSAPEGEHPEEVQPEGIVGRDT